MGLLGSENGGQLVGLMLRDFTGKSIDVAAVGGKLPIDGVSFPFLVNQTDILIA